MPSDFDRLLAELHLSAEEHLAESARSDDCLGWEELGLDPAALPVRVAPSRIAGLGVMATRAVAAGAVLAPAFIWRDGLWRTPVGRYLNHGAPPNVRLWEQGGCLMLQALRRLAAGQELLVDYRTQQLRVDCWRG